MWWTSTASDVKSTAPRIAYLLSQYPAISHTFFLNEVLAMRERGFLIETASINAIHPPSGGFPRHRDAGGRADLLHQADAEAHHPRPAAEDAGYKSRSLPPAAFQRL